MSTRPDVLIINGNRDEGEDLVRRAQAVGYRPALAKTPDEARDILCDARLRVEVALLPTRLPVADLGAAIGALRAVANDRRLEFIAAGPHPGLSGVEELREAGIRLVLWEPFPDAALRFQLNRARGESHYANQRAHPRLPVARRVRILSGNFVKAASLYTLSPGGAFVETPRPAPRNAPVNLELVLPKRDLAIEGRVLYTNVPGNLMRENLPLGMGIRFERVETGGIQAIENCLRDAAGLLDLDAPPAQTGTGWWSRLVGRFRDPR